MSRKTSLWLKKEEHFFIVDLLLYVRCISWKSIIFVAVFTCLMSGMVTASPLPLGGNGLQIGWSSVDLTPDKPVFLTGISARRVSQGVKDPITATAMALESGFAPCPFVFSSFPVFHLIWLRCQKRVT